MTATDPSTDAQEPRNHAEPVPLPQRRRSTTAPAHQLDELDIPAADLVQFMMDAVPDFMALHAAVTLGIFEFLANDELTSDELANACEADPDAMRRLMRWLHSRDFVATYRTRYQLTELGQVLTAAARPSMRHAVLVTGSSYWWEATGNLTETVRRGHPTWSGRGLSPYGYLAQNTELGAEFDRFMDARSAALGQDLAAFDDFAKARTVADLGGGLGGVLAAILQAHPHLRGILADREDVLARAHDRLAHNGLASRVQLAPGDLFDTIPDGAQIYLLSSVCHNYSDEQVAGLFTMVADAMVRVGEGAELWIAEGMLPRLPGARSRWYSTDIRMLALFPGDGVRVSDDYYRLTRQAGLRVRKSSPLPCGQALMIARLADQ
ncbi:methyltransferase [Nonomuraea jabiensis]|uniref:methyltransferase n=1 Tax=Nonomuraea jabiensis TaxID=882448 RepID=UPI003D747DDE